MSAVHDLRARERVLAILPAAYLDAGAIAGALASGLAGRAAPASGRELAALEERATRAAAVQERA